MIFWVDRFFLLQKLSLGSESLDMTSEGLGEMFEGDSADTCAGKFPLVSMGGRVNGQVSEDPNQRERKFSQGVYTHKKER